MLLLGAIAGFDTRCQIEGRMSGGRAAHGRQAGSKFKRVKIAHVTAFAGIGSTTSRHSLIHVGRPICAPTQLATSYIL